MTPQEAAAKCREMADLAQKRMVLLPEDRIERYGCGERQLAYLDAAALIDQIPTPKPWPPPEDNEELALVLAFDSLLKEWRSVECFPSDDWESINDEEGPFSHWLPMPPAPEVQG